MTTSVWLDLLNPSDADRKAAEHEVGFRIQTRDEISEIESSSRMSLTGDVLYLNTPVSYRDADTLPAIAPVGFALSPTHLVTIRFAAMQAFDTYHERFAKLDSPCSASVFAGVLEAIVDRVADVLEQVGLDLAALSRQTFKDGRRSPGSARAARDLRATLNNLGLAANKIDNLRDTLLGLARIVSFVQQSGVTCVPDDIKTRLATLRADIASLNDYDQQLTTKTSFLLDAIMGFINIEQNEVVRVLTVFSVVGIPPTFVVGLYGMNFKNMPEYDWHYGYEWGWAMIILSVVVPIVWLRAKGRL
jgi:magnesium transporter